MTLSSQHNHAQHNDTKHNSAKHNDTKHNRAQHNDTQLNNAKHNETQHINAEHNDTQHNNVQLNKILLSFVRRLKTSNFNVGTIKRTRCHWTIITRFFLLFWVILGST